MKICKSCSQYKKYSEFHRHKNTKDGLRQSCKTCRSNESKQYYVHNKQRINIRRRQYYRDNIIDDNNRNALYRQNNPEKIRKIKRNYERKLREDVNYRIITNLRNRLRSSLLSQQTYKNNTTVDLIGVPVSLLREHLEKQFGKGMSWDNYGKWHVDHIIPLSKFDLSKESQLKIACHYSNLQPLWGSENCSKGNRT